MKFRILRLLFITASVAFVLSSCRNEDNRIEPTCFDEVKNQGEIGIDCGGPCPECLPTCDDRTRNGTELFIDCGGDDCPPCATCDDNIQNAHWTFDPNLTMADFNSGNDSVGMANGILFRLVLEEGIDCGFPCDTFCLPTCEDGIQNGDELGIDCGGANCPNSCLPANCGDGMQNGQETGIDCGAPGCPDCPTPTCNDGIQNIHIEYIEATLQNPDGYVVVVETGPDCDDNFESSCPDCPIPTCFDGIQNGGEIGIDCGGPCPNPCDPTPSCGNGYQDGAETGVDCDDDDATDCPPCATCSDMILNGPELEMDCVDWPIPEYDGGSCALCISCHDEVQNQLEQDVDCGGPNCEICPQFITSTGIGQGNNPSGFVDQQTYNETLALGGADTITVTATSGPDGLFVSTGGFGIGPDFIIATGIQEFEIPGGGRFRKILTLYIPRPNVVLAQDVEQPLAQDINVTAGLCAIPVPSDEDIPYFIYTEQLESPDGTFDDCYYSNVQGGPLPNMRYTYIFDDVTSGTTGYVKGSVDAFDLYSDQFIGDDLEGICEVIDFAFNFPLF